MRWISRYLLCAGTLVGVLFTVQLILGNETHPQILFIPLMCTWFGWMGLLRFAPPPAQIDELPGSPWERLLRRLVRWLRRHRYAAVAERTRALEAELGMRPDHAKDFFRNGAPRGAFIPADPNELAVLLKDEKRLREVFSDRPSRQQLIESYSAAYQLMRAGFQRREVMEATRLLDNPLVASDPHATDGFAWPEPDPRPTTRNSE